MSEVKRWMVLDPSRYEGVTDERLSVQVVLAADFDAVVKERDQWKLTAEAQRKLTDSLNKQAEERHRLADEQEPRCSLCCLSGKTVEATTGDLGHGYGRCVDDKRGTWNGQENRRHHGGPIYGRDDDTFLHPGVSRWCVDTRKRDRREAKP